MNEINSNNQFNQSVNRPRNPGTQEFSALLNAFSEAAVVLDLRTLFIYQTNPAFIQLTAFSQLEIAGISIVDILPDFSQEFFTSGEPLTASLSRRKRNPIPVIVQGTTLNSEFHWGLLTFIPEAKHAESQGVWQSDLFNGLMDLASIREEPTLEKSLIKGFEITRTITGAKNICIYKADNQQPRLIRISFNIFSEVFPEILPSNDLAQLSSASMWIPGKKIVAEVQRAALVANLSYVATIPLGQKNALFGLMVVGDQDLQPTDRLENTMRVISAHLTAALQHFILIDNLRKEATNQKLAADVRGMVFEHSQEGILFVSPDLKILEINPSAEWMLQYAAWEVKNQPVGNVVIGPDRLMTVLESCCQGIPTHNMGNVAVHRRNGQSFPAHIQVVPVQREKENLGIVMFIRDISEHEQIRLRSQQLEQRALLGEFTAIFAHEVRNPINNISTGLQLITARLPEEDVNVDVLNRMLGDCTRLDHLMESILAFSKPQELRLEKLDLEVFLQRILDRWRPRLARVSVLPFFSAAKKLPLINGDSRALEQVFTNLISNAIDAMSSTGGTLAIHVNIDHTLPNRPQVEVSVSDNGPGIPDDIQEKMFEPFVTTKSHGTGLGLAITKRIITAHQGNITVKSFPGEQFSTSIYPHASENEMATTILIVDDEENARKNIGEYLVGKGYEVTGAGTLQEARELITTGVGDVILLDVQLPDGYGPNLLYEVDSLPARPPIIVITGYGDIETAVDAMKNGAHDFLTKPVKMPQLEQSILRAQEIVSMRRELAYLRQKQKNVNFIVGKNEKMKTVVEHAHRASQASVSVLITGETGTGKEVLAQFIHKSGPRANKQFMAINCAAIQPTVLESELFGYDKGAFTGADVRKKGLMEVADGGVLFLDEISKMPLDIQSKLLRAVEEKAFRRVGGTELIKVDIQIVSASNRDLVKMMKDGDFREDLYYRLKVVDLDLPPLRDRKEDIPDLVGFFMREQNSRQGLNITDVSPRAMQAMIAYDWPGNIRELSNAIERGMLFCDDPVLDINHLPLDVTKPK